MMVIVKFILKKKGIVLPDIMLDAEAWRTLITTSQKFFQAKRRKGLPEKEIFKIRVVEFRIDPDKMVQYYNTKFLPILGKNDPLALKLTRNNHVQESFLEKVHIPITTSLRNLSKGKFEVLYPDARNYLHQIADTCTRCCEQSEWSYQQQLGKIYVKMDTFQHAFENISLDPLGNLEVKAFNNSRKVVKLWPLLIRCFDNGGVICMMMETMQTKSVVSALLRLQLRMGEDKKGVYGQWHKFD